MWANAISSNPMEEWTQDALCLSPAEHWKPPRWYQHFRCKRYGRNFYVNSPRIASVGLHIAIYCFPHGFTLGLSVYQDEGGDWETQIGLVIFDIRIGRLHYLSKRKARQRHELYLQEQQRQLVVEAEQYLEGASGDGCG